MHTSNKLHTKQIHDRGVVQKGTCAIMVELLGRLHRQNDAGLLSYVHSQAESCIRDCMHMDTVTY